MQRMNLEEIQVFRHESCIDQSAGMEVLQRFVKAVLLQAALPTRTWPAQGMKNKKRPSDVLISTIPMLSGA